eukprot:1863158-Pleurochrysis_carterae.AAC.1
MQCLTHNLVRSQYQAVLRRLSSCDLVSRTLALSLSHPRRAHTLALVLSHSRTHALARALLHVLSRAHTLALTLSHTRTHSFALTLSHSRSRTHTRALTLSHVHSERAPDRVATPAAGACPERSNGTRRRRRAQAFERASGRKSARLLGREEGGKAAAGERAKGSTWEGEP